MMDPQEREENDRRIGDACMRLMSSMARATERIADLGAGVALHMSAKQFAIEHETDPLRRDVEQLRQIADTLHAAANWIDPPVNGPHTFAGRDRCPRCKRIHANDLVPEGPDPRGGPFE